MKPSDLDYNNLIELTKKYNKGRSESANFLNWFLENIFRLDETTADDCICDKENDKGIDGIFVDHNASTIIFFQSKISRSEGRTIGDKQIKEFSGSLQQFSDNKKVEAIIQGQANDDLKNILIRNKIPDLLMQQYSLQGIFITNCIRDYNTIEVEKLLEDITLYCPDDIANNFIEFDADEGISDDFTFDISLVGKVQLSIDENTKVYVMPVPAVDLVRLRGIDDGKLFSQNVRYSLGNTAVNKSISRSVNDQGEHKNFALYHNGITLICQNAHFEDNDNSLVVRDYVVVNGAQSISTFFKNSKKLTDDLMVFVKIISLKSTELSRKITINSNNQNAIKPRDLRSNHDLMLRLKAEFENSGTDYEFEIKRGQITNPKKVAISNDLAGRELLAFDLNEPNLCHQIGKVFDDKYAEIFGRREVDVGRIIFVHELQKIVSHSLEEMKHRPMAGYLLTRYFLLSVAGQILRKFENGRSFLKDKYRLNDANSRNEVLIKMKDIVLGLVTDLDYEIEDKSPSFDYKRDLKNTAEIAALRKALIQSYEKDFRRGRAKGFGTELT